MSESRIRVEKEKWSLAKRILPFIKSKVALLVDGPNLLRKEFNIRLEDVLSAAEHLGRVQVARVYINEHAPEKLFEAIYNSGLEPVVTTGDIYIEMGIDAMDIMLKSDIKIIALGSRHARCVPILHKAKSMDRETAVIGFDPGFSTALQKTADYVFKLETS
ncbi:MAG: NYN domain-containing protein [Candidatus Odinarchaeia archaeon]